VRFETSGARRRDRARLRYAGEDSLAVSSFGSFQSHQSRISAQKFTAFPHHEEQFIAEMLETAPCKRRSLT